MSHAQFNETDETDGERCGVVGSDPCCNTLTDGQLPTTANEKLTAAAAADELAASGPEMNALKHGRYSRRLQEDAAPWRADQIAAIRADLGDDVATLKAHTVEQLGTVLVILRFLGGNLMADGPLTGKGRQRAATTAYLQTLDRFMRLAQSVGLERVAKPVVSPADWLEGKA